jgi:hypothetical protein
LALQRVAAVVVGGALTGAKAKRGRDLVLGVALVGALSAGLSACGGPSGGKLKLSVASGVPGTIVQLTGEAGSGCVVDNNWFGFSFHRSGTPGKGPASKMTTPVASNGSWSASFAVPSFLGAASKSATGALVSAGLYQFTAPNCTGHRVATAAFRVRPATPPAGNAAYVGITTTTDGQGYWLVQADGTVHAFGDAHYYGSLARKSGTAVTPVIGIARTYDNGGYWLADAKGQVYTFGDARPHGSLSAALASRAPIAGLAPTPNGGGYYLVGADGHVYGFGDAPLDGMPGSSLAPYDAIGARPAGGYVVTAATDEAVYTYPGGLLTAGGPGTALSATLVGTAVTPSGNGTWQAGTDGGVVTTGDADEAFFGSVPGEGIVLKAPVTAIAATPDGRGYWLVGATGTVFNFGDAHLFASSTAAA